jgi:uncharacterized membrane protein
VKLKHIALIRFYSSLILAVVCLLVSHQFRLSWGNSLELSWIAFGLSYIIQGVATLTKKNVDIRKHAQDEDLGAWLQFLVIVLGCAVSLFAVLVWNKEDPCLPIPQEILFVVSVSLSWFVVHLSFTFRYAHLYYGDLNASYSKHVKGLEFPNDEHPDYLDFAYYSYTIGMTFQVSDVAAGSKSMRRLTLLHAILSFVFNTILVALTINEILK